MDKKAQIVADTVSAGFPKPAEQYLQTPLDLNELLVRNRPATFFVRVSGDSMEGAGIRNGDLLVVDRSLDAKDGDIVVAYVGDEFTVKYLKRGGDGSVALHPANPKYKPIVFSGEMTLSVFGVVTAAIHRYVRV